MVRVYGKRSRSWMYGGSQLDEESEVELSDDGEIDESDEQQRASVTEPNCVVSRSQIESNDSNQDSGNASSSNTSFLDSKTSVMATSFPSNDESSPLKAFDFLQSHSAGKRKKNKHRKVLTGDPVSGEFDSSQNGLDNSINKTVEDLNDFLASLQSKNAGEDIKERLEKELEKSVEDSSRSTSDRIMYDRSRTMLASKDEDEVVEQPELDLQAEVVPQVSKSSRETGERSTRHYNELKNVGEALKYQDELDFLTNEVPEVLNVETLISRLLSLALAVEQDEEFREYIDRHSANEVCRWCFGEKIISHPIVTLLQSYLLMIIQLPPENLPLYFDQFIYRSLRFDEPPAAELLTNKLTRLNLADFLQRTKHRPAQYYSLQLCLKYRDCLSLQRLTAQVVDIANRRSLNSGEDLPIYPVVEHILTSDSLFLTDIKQANVLLESLISALPAQSCNEHLVKSLIILTNEKLVLNEMASKPREAFQQCLLNFILEHIHPVECSTADLLILYLGLLLNVLDVCDMQLFERSQLSRAREMLFAVSGSDADRFIVCMYSLNLTHVLFGAGEKLRQEEKDLLKSILHSFLEEAQNDNQSIRDRIKIALNNFL